MYNFVIDVLEILKGDSTLLREQKAEANGLILLMNTFDFALTLHLIKKFSCISNELSQTLQKKYQDIVNAMQLVSITKHQLRTLQDDG